MCIYLGDETEEDDEIDVYDDNDEEYCPNSSSFSARNMSHYTPTAPAPPSLPPPPSSSVSNYSSSNKMLATSLFSPSSPLTSCNIKVRGGIRRTYYIHILLLYSYKVYTP